MRDRIDHESRLPLYHQVAEAVRYRIATGELAAGRRLPSLRRAAELWGVNLHTVRRAYSELAEQGVIGVRPRSGAVVLDGAVARAREASDLDAFLRGILREGRDRWHLTPGELTTALSEVATPTPAATDLVHVVECSETQSRDLAGQLESRWRVQAEPWSLEWDGEPGAGVVLATYFHHEDVRRRWPNRFPAVRFVAIEPDPGIRDRLAALEAPGGRCEVVLCERTEAMARNIAADLSRILPGDRYSIRIAVGAAEPVLEREHVPVLLPPRIWGQLTDTVRNGALEVRYVFEKRGLERLAFTLGWERR